MSSTKDDALGNASPSATNGIGLADVQRLKVYTPPPIAGYRTLTQVEVDLMNEVKAMGERVSQLIERIERNNGIAPVDGRWISIATTDLQKGFMSLTRAIAKPTGF